MIWALGGDRGGKVPGARGSLGATRVVGGVSRGRFEM